MVSKAIQILSAKQKETIGTIATAVHLQGITITADVIWSSWPVDKSEIAGRQPKLEYIKEYLETGVGKHALLKRGLPTDAVNIANAKLTPEQIALIAILTDNTLRMGLTQRLKKAGVSSAKYRAWMRQANFSEAIRKIVPQDMELAAHLADVQLMEKAQNGDLNAIKYLNELMGRGPDNKQNVDAVKFSKLVLEAVMRNCNQEQIQAIASEIELAAKQEQLNIREIG